MPSFCIYPNLQKDWAVNMVMELSQYLMKNGYSYSKENPDFCIVIGGDGTLYHFLDELKGKVILIGSETTYMAQLNNNNWKAKIITLMNRNKSVKLPILDVRCDKAVVGHAMNDVVFHTNDHRIVNIKCLMGRQRMEFKGDGLIIATPFGSDAYSFSAGGKRLRLSSKQLVVTPICPYLRSVKSVVTNADVIDVIAPTNSSLVLDGRLALVSCQDKVYTITKSRRSVEFLQ